MKTLNMVGKPCPIPVIEAKKALRKVKAGQSVVLLVDNAIAGQNLEKMALGQGHQFRSELTEAEYFLVTITAGQSGSVAATGEESGDLVVAISRDSLGEGHVDLSRTLMKAFINSLTELDYPPQYLLFFNGGAFLTTEGSTVLEDLEKLVERGTIITTCGACLNFYKLTEKLKVGSVTNMYAIAGTMAQAGRLINL